MRAIYREGFLTIVALSLLYLPFGSSFAPFLVSQRSHHYAIQQLASTSVDEDAPAVEVVGADFFGGNNKQKTEFYDPNVEAAAVLETTGQVFDRFTSSENAFDDAQTARQLQQLLDGQDSNLSYATNVVWESPFKTKSRSPMEELVQAREFYNDFAITLVSSQGNTYRWEAVAVWPTFWEPSVVVTGTSTLTLSDDNTTIAKQADTLDVDLFQCIATQIFPRFWDVYHVGMTPAAQMAPKKTLKNTLQYQVQQIPNQWVWQIATRDTGDRQDTVALPDHGFTTVIKTMGPSKDHYVTTSNIEISIQPSKQSVLFNIPIPVQYRSWTQDDSPDDNDDDKANTATFAFAPAKWVAITSTRLGPQESGIAAVRQELYERVIKDGESLFFQPKLVNGRPVFSYYQRDVKACFTNNGLGMAVYDWRPDVFQPNAVGLELIQVQEQTRRSSVSKA